jgi:hypothetical protein
MANEFLTLGSLNVPVFNATPAEDNQVVGGYGRRAHSGNYRAEGRGLVNAYSVVTKQLNYAEISKLRTWLLGLGYSFPFDVDLFSHNGLGPDAGFSASITLAGGQFGGYVTVTSAGFLQYTVEISAPYSFGVWKDDGGGFVHYVLTDDGSTVTQYKSGAAHTPIGADDITNWGNLAAGQISLEGKTIAGVAAASDYDDLFVVPFVADAEDVASWAASVNPFSPLPAHRMSGKFIGDDVKIVNVSIVSGAGLQFGEGGVWHQNAQQLSFTLQEKTRRNQ